MNGSGQAEDQGAATMRRYPRYKYSGVPWLGEVPAHWKIISLRYMATEYCDGPFGSALKSEHYVERGVRVIRLQNIRAGEFDNRDAAFIDNEYFVADLLRHSIAPGDLLIAGLGDERNIVGRACVAPAHLGPAMVKADCFRFRLQSSCADPRFVAAQLTAGAVSDAGMLSAGSTRSRIPLSAMAGRKVALPPLNEQRSIADFLDCETAKIDLLIGKKRRLVELLEEKRQAVITRIVTNGLDPTAPMKSSGADWLGDVPAHWNVKPLKWVAVFLGGATPSKDRPDFWQGNIPWVSPKDMKSFFIEDTIDHLSPAAVDGSSLRWIPHQSVLIVVRGLILARTVPIAINTRSLTLNQDMKAIVPSAELHPMFLAYFLRSTAQKLLSIVEEAGHGTKALRTDLLSATKICVPPLSEQLSIAGECQRIEQEISTVAARCSRIVAALEERRTSLVTAAVSGKIDLRGRAVIVADPKPDRFYFRVLVAAEITHRHQGRQRFGRVKLQKLLYLAEAHAGIHELQGNYFREAAGPLDGRMIADAERGMTSSEYFDANPQDGTGNGISYTQLARAGGHAAELARLLGSRAIALARTVELIRDLDTRASEVIATIYALWNDALLDGENPDDDWIVQAFLNEWHPEKREKFKEAEVRHWLNWMRRNSVVPAGSGPRTISTVPRDMFYDPRI